MNIHVLEFLLVAAQAFLPKHQSMNFSSLCIFLMQESKGYEAIHCKSGDLEWGGGRPLIHSFISNFFCVRKPLWKILSTYGKINRYCIQWSHLNENTLSPTEINGISSYCSIILSVYQHMCECTCTVISFNFNLAQFCIL